jgi:hypothetical protein
MRTKKKKIYLKFFCDLPWDEEGNQLKSKEKHLKYPKHPSMTIHAANKSKAKIVTQLLKSAINILIVYSAHNQQFSVFFFNK